ncbi:hypothetical protein ACTNE0_07620 [Bacillota bacterium HCP3S3_E9]
MSIQSNKLVRRKDGSIAYKMILTCRNKNCSNHGEIVQTIYDPVELSEDE